MSTVRSINENHLVRKLGGAANRGSDSGKSTPYTIPSQTCATCGQSSRTAYHWDCRRDSSGRLLVKGES